MIFIMSILAFGQPNHRTKTELHRPTQITFFNLCKHFKKGLNIAMWHVDQVHLIKSMGSPCSFGFELVDRFVPHVAVPSKLNLR